jgi:hypothetical protein
MGHLMGHLEAAVITDMNQGSAPLAQSPWSEWRRLGDLKPRMGANPNRISSPFAAPKATVSLQCAPQSAQVSAVVPGKATEAAAARRNPSWPSSGPARASYSPGRRMGANASGGPLVTHPHDRKDNQPCHP